MMARVVAFPPERIVRPSPTKHGGPKVREIRGIGAGMFWSACFWIAVWVAAIGWGIF
jgi:hypothetical protein